MQLNLNKRLKKWVHCCESRVLIDIPNAKTHHNDRIVLCPQQDGRLVLFVLVQVADVLVGLKGEKKMFKNMVYNNNTNRSYETAMHFVAAF